MLGLIFYLLACVVFCYASDMTEVEKNSICPHGYPQEARAECPACKRMLELYSDDQYETLYRYENPEAPYNKTREGEVSREHLIGQWFTNNLGDLTTYIRRRQPGGRIAVVRVPKSDLQKYDATTNPETSTMDIELGNYIVPEQAQQESRLQIPFTVAGSGNNRFLTKDWDGVKEFVQTELKPEKLIRVIKGE